MVLNVSKNLYFEDVVMITLFITLTNEHSDLEVGGPGEPVIVLSHARERVLADAAVRAGIDAVLALCHQDTTGICGAARKQRENC